MFSLILRLPSPTEFNNVWLPKKEARMKKQSEKELITLLKLIRKKLMSGETNLCCYIDPDIIREDLDLALAANGWKLVPRRLKDSNFYIGYDLVPL